MEWLAYNSGERSDIRPRILILEESSGDEGLLMRHLQKANLAHFVKIITDGKAALDYLNAEAALGRKLIAIFLDLALSEMSGLDVLKAIRSREESRSLPVIVMTSSNNPVDLAECRRLGVCSYVQKPMAFASFVKAVADNFHVPRTYFKDPPSERNPTVPD